MADSPRARLDRLQEQVAEAIAARSAKPHDAMAWFDQPPRPPLTPAEGEQTVVDARAAGVPDWFTDYATANTEAAP